MTYVRDGRATQPNVSLVELSRQFEPMKSELELSGKCHEVLS